MVAFQRAMEVDYRGVLDRVAKRLGNDRAGDVSSAMSRFRQPSRAL